MQAKGQVTPPYPHLNVPRAETPSFRGFQSGPAFAMNENVGVQTTFIFATPTFADHPRRSP